MYAIISSVCQRAVWSPGFFIVSLLSQPAPRAARWYAVLNPQMPLPTTRKSDVPFILRLF